MSDQAAAPAVKEEAPAATPAANSASPAAKPKIKKNKPKSPSKQTGSLDDVSIEIEFMNLMTKLRKLNPNHTVAYQVNNFKEGLECTFRVSRDDSDTSFTSNFNAAGTAAKVKKEKPKKVLTPEQLEKLEAKREKKKAARAKKFAERKEKELAEKGEGESPKQAAKPEAAPAAAAPKPEAAASKPEAAAAKTEATAAKPEAAAPKAQ